MCKMKPQSGVRQKKELSFLSFPARDKGAAMPGAADRCLIKESVVVKSPARHRNLIAAGQLNCFDQCGV